MIRIRIRKPMNRWFAMLLRGYAAAHPFYEVRHK